MSFLDFYVDPDWIKVNWPLDPRCRISVEYRGVALEVILYGDDEHVKHVRLKTPFENVEERNKFANAEHRWIQMHLESIYALLTGRLLNFNVIAGHLSVVGTCENEEDAPLVFNIDSKVSAPIDYDSLRQALPLLMKWDGIEAYLYFLLQASDPSTLNEFKWFNYYRILEARFNWHEFGFSGFDQFLLDSSSLLTRSDIERIRGGFHANKKTKGHVGIGHRESDFGKRIDETLPEINRLAIAAINSLPNSGGLQFYVRA